MAVAPLLPHKSPIQLYVCPTLAQNREEAFRDDSELAYSVFMRITGISECSQLPTSDSVSQICPSGKELTHPDMLSLRERPTLNGWSMWM